MKKHTDIRRKTAIIIEREGEFLVGVQAGTTELRWSLSPWDAWQTRERGNALMVARRVRGRLFLFNPIAGQVRKMESLHPNAP